MEHISDKELEEIIMKKRYVVAAVAVIVLVYKIYKIVKDLKKEVSQEIEDIKSKAKDK